MSSRAVQDLAEAGRIIREGLNGCRARVYLFGSRARGEGGRSSDIDVAVLPLSPLPGWILSALREDLEESRVPYRVDLVDLSMADPSFRELVLREGRLWIDSGNG